MAIASGPRGINDGLIYFIDPSNVKSYAGVGTVIYDLSGNGKTSYFTNGALYQNYQKGVVLVDGNNDYISTPIFNLTSPVTVSAWVKNVADDAPLMGAAGNGIGYANGEVLFYFSGKSILIQGGNSGGKYYQFPQLNLNEWVHLTMTRDVGNNMRVYLNGIGSTSNPQSNSNTIQMNQIGRYSSFTDQYNTRGSIGEVRIYNRALSASEVIQNYNATKKKFNPEENIVRDGLILNLDPSNHNSYSGSGNTIYNLTGLGNTGILTNGPTFSGLNGGSIVFDGSNDFIQFPAKVTPSASTPYTVSVWCRRNNNNTVENLLSEWTYATVSNAFFLGFDGTLVRFSDNWIGINISGAGTTNVWMNIVAINTVSNAYIYFNGTLAATKGSGFTYTGSGPLTIGRQGEFTEFFNGNIAQAQIYNIALTQQEVQQNYNAIKNRFPV